MPDRPESDTSSLRLAGLDYSVLQQCMHCGMCLPSCPTYTETLRERHSPRGRISLMRAIADGELELTPTFGEEMYYCLGCLACTSACPAGVDYATLLETARSDIEENKILDTSERSFWRQLSIKWLFMRPRSLRAAARLLWFYQNSGLEHLARILKLTKLLPENLQRLEPQTPRIRSQFSDERIAQEERPGSSPKYRVALLTGCVQDLAFSEINRDTADVLLANNCTVVTPRLQHCCGSLHSHNGEHALAQKLARKQIDSFDLENLDAIITNAGGCGSHLKTFGTLLSGDPEYADRARLWDQKLKDIHEWLSEIGIIQPPPLPKAMTVTYHPSCHLNHGQGIIRQPEQLLNAIPNLTLVPLPQASACCGSAGIYNITHPEQANRMQKEKCDNVLSTGCHTVCTANPGCHLQLQNGLDDSTSVAHPITLLAQAYRNR